MHKLMTVRIEETKYQEFRLATIARGMTTSEVVRKLVEDWLAKNPAPAVPGGAKPAARKSSPKSKKKRK